MAKIGDVVVTITDEQIARTNDITDRLVENGSIADNVKREPEIIKLTGVVGQDGWPKLKELQDYYRDGKLVHYTGRNVFKNVVIEKLDTSHPYSVKNGFMFTCTLKEIRIAKSRTVEISVPKAIKPAVKKTTNAGRKTTKPKPTKTRSKGVSKVSVPASKTVTPKNTLPLRLDKIDKFAPYSSNRPQDISLFNKNAPYVGTRTKYGHTHSGSKGKF